MTETVMSPPVTEEEIYSKIKEILKESFRLDDEKLKLEANLFTDLGLDSIDAVEMALRLQEMTGERVKPDEFKAVQTIGDVVKTVHRMLNN